MRIISRFIYLLLIFLISCGAPDEQQANRQKLIEGLKDHKVKRATEDQVHSAAYQEGRRLTNYLNEKSGGDLSWPSTASGKQYLDSLSTANNHGAFIFIASASTQDDLNTTQRALLDAYQFSAEEGHSLSENVQTTPGDFLLYTYPVTHDGQLTGMWSLLLSRKTLIRNL
ncbi:MAG: hypothetical protein DHS20C17_31780 [Cyclobacteriaceae bacterium]|nr:MAG: hypothetical protein DHS20C17_31780 [Cyclobacteriaceae bacterium]